MMRTKMMGTRALRTRCDEVQAELPDALEGRTAEPAGAEALAHARGCAECGAAAGFWGRLREEQQAAGSALPPAVYYEGVLAELHRELERGETGRGEMGRKRGGLRRPGGGATRAQVATRVATLFVLAWGGMAAGTLGEWGGARGGDEGGRPGRGVEMRRLADAGGARELIAVAGLGWVTKDSPVAGMSAEELRALGIVEPAWMRREMAAKEEEDERWMG